MMRTGNSVTVAVVLSGKPAWRVMQTYRYGTGFVVNVVVMYQSW